MWKYSKFRKYRRFINRLPNTFIVALTVVLIAMNRHPGPQTWIVDALQPTAPLETDWLARTLGALALFVCAAPIGLLIDTFRIWSRRYLWTQIIFVFCSVNILDTYINDAYGLEKSPDLTIPPLVLGIALSVPFVIELILHLRALVRAEEEDESEEYMTAEEQKDEQGDASNRASN